MLRLMSGLIRKNRLPARIRGWAGTATGRHIHVVHISHTPTERAHTDPKKISFGKKTSGKEDDCQEKPRSLIYVPGIAFCSLCISISVSASFTSYHLLILSILPLKFLIVYPYTFLLQFLMDSSRENTFKTIVV